MPIVQEGWEKSFADSKAGSMITIAYPAIYAACLHIAYREVDDRLTGDALNSALVTAADSLYKTLTRDVFTRA